MPNNNKATLEAKLSSKRLLNKSTTYNILRLFLALIVKEDLEYYQYDVKNTFPELELKEEIFLKILEKPTYKVRTINYLSDLKLRT
ncbi:uncharacterized protein RAG0_16755 [Rhynchosporium agropyri]|uniref:Reverse transcriptase Ty1/copia-type domain-containing protein n=1 Tax=Rhynchosporium agropyri TaxID=914238 RepID=A0A1E1LRQ0_9HELO|nr:uncharacterized protein RAG0_16755 [Rhynchosporium agropyri]